VDVAEQQETVDDASQYHPAHAGWVGITTYTDNHGNLRVKTEVLVAGSMITADASDDTILPDS
jgi:HJR/Mrr/RecB family endonuclease